MCTINSRIVYTKGELYRIKNCRPDCQFTVLNALVLHAIRRMFRVLGFEFDQPCQGRRMRQAHYRR